MAQFAQRHVFLRRRINELSPMATIPSEILIEIFQIACQPVYNGNNAGQAVTPLFLGSICRRWRDVTWSTPLLWNTILLHVSPSRKQHGNQAQLLKDWLLNARSAPLSIKLFAEDEDESVFHAFEAIMRILVTRSNYWLTFDSLLPPRCHKIFKNIPFPMLTSVSLYPPRNTITTFNTPSNIMFLTAPNLVGVNLPRYFPVVLPWEPVRHFRTRWLTVAECLIVLQQAPNLQKCQFEYVYLPADSLISITIMPHVQLKHLHVGFQDSGTSMSFFDSITLPSLSNLRIQCNGTRRLLLSSITSLVLRSACNLERFTIEFPFDYTDLITCLEAIPSLTYLHLKMLGRPDMGLTRHFVASLDPLISNSNRSLLLPNLRYFEYNGRVLCDCRTIVDMLAHRWHLLLSSGDGESSPSQSIFTGVSTSSKLKLAEILSTVPYDITADVQEEIRNLSEEGMLVRIESLV